MSITMVMPIVIRLICDIIYSKWRETPDSKHFIRLPPLTSDHTVSFTPLINLQEMTKTLYNSAWVAYPCRPVSSNQALFNWLASTNRLFDAGFSTDDWSFVRLYQDWVVMSLKILHRLNEDRISSTSFNCLLAGRCKLLNLLSVCRWIVASNNANKQRRQQWFWQKYVNVAASANERWRWYHW